MNFDFSHDQKVLRDQARKFLAEHASSARVRRILDTDAPYDTELWQGMGEMGWMSTAIPEAYGGAGFGYLELCVIAEELGRSLAPSPFSSTIYLAAEALLRAGSDAQKKRWLPRIAQGQAIGCFALAEGPQAATADNVTTRAAAGRINGVKVPVLDGDVADFAVVAARSRGAAACALPRGSGRSRRQPHSGVDGRSDALARAHRVRRRAGRAAWRRRRGLAARRAPARSRRRARGVRAGGRRAGRARHGAGVRARSVRLRPADRVVPGDQAQAGRHVRGRRAGAIECVLRRVGSLEGRARAARRGRGRPAWRPPRRTITPPRRISRRTAAWVSRGNSTVTSTIAAPSSPASGWGARGAGRTS